MGADFCLFGKSVNGQVINFDGLAPPKSAALLAAPGVLNPTAFYACINILHVLTRGGARTPKTQGILGHVGVMLAHFSLLGGFFSFLADS